MAKKQPRKHFTKEKISGAPKLGYAKKSLGQNFLHSESALGKIVAAGNLKKGDTVLEIGPGRGALTKKLLETGASVIAVEKDRELVPYLRELFKKEVEKGQLTVIEADILDFEPTDYKLTAGKYKLVANIPYYITGAIFKKFFEHVAQPSGMVLLVQDEVAKRIVASPRHGGARTTKESILSLSVKAYGNPRYVAKISRGSFTPAPNVDSAILSIEEISKKSFTKDTSEKTFFTLLHAGFAHKRKLLSANLRGFVDKNTLVSIYRELGLLATVRAEDIPLSTWLLLCKKIQTR